MNQSSGTISRIRGSVVDVHFPDGLPGLYQQLGSGPCVIEVRAHLDRHTVRGIALTPTQGLQRGAAVDDSGHLLRVPVGNATLGRALNVLGEPVDGKAPIPPTAETLVLPEGFPVWVRSPGWKRLSEASWSRVTERGWQPIIK